MERGGHKVLSTAGECALPHVTQKIENALPLYYSNPASPLAVAGTEPNVVGIGEAYFEGAVGPQAARILEFPLQPIAQFTQAGLGSWIWHCPFDGVLLVLSAERASAYSRGTEKQKIAEGPCSQC
jgi:hypothetical protein